MVSEWSVSSSVVVRLEQDAGLSRGETVGPLEGVQRTGRRGEGGDMSRKGWCSSSRMLGLW